MYITYTNYLLRKTDNKFVSRYVFSNLKLVRQCEKHTFTFGICFSPTQIENQAKEFAESVISIGLFENSFLNNANRLHVAKPMIMNAYIYSYLKSIFYAHGLVFNKSASILGPSSNIVFQGHKLLHDIIVEGCINHYTPLNNTLTLQIELPDDIVKHLKSFPLWSEIYNEKRGRFFDSELESVLDFMHKKCNTVVSLGSISNTTSLEVKNLLELPLGNLTFSQKVDEILYVEGESTLSDKLSYFWGKANMITLISAPFLDRNDSVYDSIPFSDYDENGVSFEIQSITGYSPLTEPRTNYDYTRVNAPSNFNDDFQPSSMKSYSVNVHSKVSRKTTPRKSTKLNMVKNSFERVTDNVIDLIKRSDEVFTPERVELVADILSQITGKRPKLKTLNQYVGDKLVKVFENNGIVLNDKIIRSGEFDYYYADSHKVGNQYKTELVGVQKLITQK